MNSYMFMGLDDVEEREEISSREKSFIKRAIAYIKIRRQACRATRNSITRDHAGAHERLRVAFFTDSSINVDCTSREGISPLIKCTSAILQLAYGVNASFLDEYMQMSERSSRTALDHFCQAVMKIYGPEYLRKPTVTDIEKLYRNHKKKHGFSGMLGSLDCSGSGLHAFFGVAGSNNDINVLYQSPLFNDLKTGRAQEIPFVANDVSYPSGCYLVDGIYPELAPLVKTIPEPADDDHKRILHKQKKKSARKDMERAFGVLKKKWVILANPTRVVKKDRIVNMMYTCIILHNMIGKYKKVAISPKWFPDEAHQPEDILRNEQQVKQVMR
nr:hypothetical protein [Tanacetum cinerariifolium]